MVKTQIVQEVKVRPIDTKKMVAAINKDLKDYQVEIYRKFALVERDGKVAVIDKECIGQVWGRGSKHPFVLSSYKKVRGGFCMFPCLETHFSLDEVRKYLTGEELTLEKFMADRYDYNSRIRSNTFTLLGFINESPKRS